MRGSVSTTASAERYDVHVLGDSPVSYIEHRNSLNNDGLVAWTELVSNAPQARVTDASDPGVSGWPGSRTTDLHAMLAAGSSTYANDFMSRAEDINNRGDVVGYASDTSLEFRRHAVLWFDNGNGLNVVDLHAGLEAHSTIGGDYDMTAAYGVSERVGNYLFVAGYGRRSLESGSTPMVWRVRLDTGVVNGVYGYASPIDGSMNYGILYDVAARQLGNGQIEFAAGGGVGGQNSGGAYINAYGYLQNVNTGTSGAFSAPTVSAAPYVTSFISRVEVIDGEYFAAGSALESNGISSAFLWDVYANTVEVGGAIAGGDVAIGMGLGMREDAGAVPGYPQVLGASAAGSGAASSGSANGQAATIAFHAYSGVGSNLDRTCDLNAQVPDSAQDPIEVATDMNSAGSVVGWQGTSAVVAVPTEPDVQLTLKSKIAPVVAGTPYMSIGLNYWYVELQDAQLSATNEQIVGGYLFGADEPGCTSRDLDVASNACDNIMANLQHGDLPTPRRFTNAVYSDIARTQRAGVSSRVYWISDNGRASYTPRGPLPPVGYLQAVAITNTGRCLLSDVVELDENSFDNNTCDDITEPVFGGTHRDCVADNGSQIQTNLCETDITWSDDHCGACGHNCSTCYANAGCNGGECTGTPTQDAWEPPVSTYFAGGQEYQTGWFTDSLANIHPGHVPDNLHPTIFPETDVDTYLFVVNDRYNIGSNDHVLDGGVPTGDTTESTNWWEGSRPTVHLTAPSGQSLELCTTLTCERGGKIGNLEIWSGTGTDTITWADNHVNLMPANTTSYEYCIVVPAGETRFIETFSECGATSNDPGSYDDGVLTNVVISHHSGDAMCYNQTGDPYYRIRLGNKTRACARNQPPQQCFP